VSDVESGETILGPIRTGHRDVCAVAYSPDGSKFATGGFESTSVIIWDSTTGEQLHEFQHHTAVWCLAWTSADAEKLISGSRNGEIRIFDTATWNKIADLNAHNDQVTAIALSRNNRFLASTSGDCTARLWDLETNLQVGLPLHHEADVVCGTLSADGMSLVCHDTSGKIYTWDVGAILKEHHLEHLLPISDAVSVK
jgi:WD40 repeat protein